MTYTLLPGSSTWWSNTALPIASKGDDDVLGRMSGLLKEGTMSWQTLLPDRYGEATVSIRLEEKDGDLLIGRQVNVIIRPKLRERVRRTISVVGHVLGLLGVLAAGLLQMSSLLLS